MARKEVVFGLIPFHVIPSSPDYEKLVDAHKQTVDILRKETDIVVAVSDGSNISDFIGYWTMHSRENKGKAEAIRSGLRLISDYPNVEPMFILQTDADFDQDPNDAKKLLGFFKENNILPSDPVLVVGDRYHQGQEETSEHRQTMLVFQRAFCKALGFELRDPVSGFRCYTSSFAKEFLEISQSQHYGVEIEQVVVANLIKARVHSIPLSYSRNRDPFTHSSKFLDSIDAILIHRNRLQENGLGDIVNAFGKMKTNMQKESECFIFDLECLGEKGEIQFLLDDGKYSTKIIS